MKTLSSHGESYLPLPSHPARFLPGGIYITPMAQAALTQYDVLRALSCHLRGEWGQVFDSEVSANERAVRKGRRVLSTHRSSTNVMFLVVTERDRVATTILLAEED